MHQARHLRIRAPAVCFLILFVATTASAKDKKPPKRNETEKPKDTRVERPKREKAERYMVVESDGELVVMKSSELAERNKALGSEYQAAFKKYREEMKAAKDAGEKFTEPRPVKKSLRRRGSSYKTEEEASVARAKLLEARDKLKGSRKPAARPEKDKDL
ncbi:MAG: hypothetical protein WBF93_03530 [Pirellulales bacterium]